MESEDWHRIGMAGGISALILLVSRYRWIYVGAAAAFIGLRLVAGSLFLPSFDAIGRSISFPDWDAYFSRG